MPIHVDYAAVDATKGALATGHEEIVTTLTRLKSLVAQLVESGFVTEKASPAFFESYNNWNQGATQAIAGIEGMQQFLAATVQGHQELDQGLASQAKG